MPKCNNPTQTRAQNGTWFLNCDSRTLYSGPNVTGPWTHIADIPTGPVKGTYEVSKKDCEWSRSSVRCPVSNVLF